jgi:hypothetical protein
MIPGRGLEARSSQSMTNKSAGAFITSGSLARPAEPLEPDPNPDASLRDPSFRLRVAKLVRPSTRCRFLDPEDQVGPERRGHS